MITATWIFLLGSLPIKVDEEMPNFPKTCRAIALVLGVAAINYQRSLA